MKKALAKTMAKIENREAVTKNRMKAKGMGPMKRSKEC